MDKKPWLSKTVWFNALVAGFAFWPTGAQWVSENSATVLAGISMVGMLLRAFTKDKLVLKD